MSKIPLKFRDNPISTLDFPLSMWYNDVHMEKMELTERFRRMQDSGNLVFCSNYARIAFFDSLGCLAGGQTMDLVFGLVELHGMTIWVSRLADGWWRISMRGNGCGVCAEDSSMLSLSFGNIVAKYMRGAITHLPVVDKSSVNEPIVAESVSELRLKLDLMGGLLA